MLQKRTFKVLAAIPKRDGGHWWMRCGNGHTNKDDSINVYLDAVPRDLKFTLRELDDEDLRRREAYRASHGEAEGYRANRGEAEGYRANVGEAEAASPTYSTPQ